MNNRELSDYFESAIEQLIADVLKAAVTNPGEAAFLMKYALTGKKANKIREEYEKKGIHIPAFLIASIASDCNLHCTGCYARANETCGEKETEEALLTCAEWEDIFDQASALGICFILLAGGEPLMRREMIEMASRKKKIIFPFFTNGTMLDEGYIKLLRKNRNLLPVLSIEGEREKTDERRGEGVYQKVSDVMEQLRQAKILFGASVTVTTENVKEICSDQFMKKLRESECKILFYVEYVPVTQNTVHLAPTEKERTYLEERLEMLREQYKDIVFLSFPGDEKFTGGCLAAGRGFFHINPYGNAEPCPFSPYSDRNVKEHNLLEILNSPLFERLKETELVGGEHDGGCALFTHRDEVQKLAGKEK